MERGINFLITNYHCQNALGMEKKKHRVTLFSVKRYLTQIIGLSVKLLRKLE